MLRLLLFLSASTFLIPVNGQTFTVHVLGTAQDAGRPQVGCVKPCCVQPDGHPMPHEPVVCLGITQEPGKGAWLVEATPDFTAQWNQLTALNQGVSPAHIAISHAHIGHYTGLMYTGREAMNTHLVEVFGSPRFIGFLRESQPWKQLVDLQNIWPQEVIPGDHLKLENGRISALAVPHRDEISDTYGYVISGPTKSLLFIPDIDKWERWEHDLDSLLDHVDYALLDATFFSDRELPGRSMAEIPHPFVLETMKMARAWPEEKRSKIHFLHFNHSNPLLDPNSKVTKKVEQAGFHLCRTGQSFAL